MDRKHKIYSVEVSTYTSKLKGIDVIDIEWDANIGFGQYQIYKENGKWKADSEWMDRGDDKDFLRELMSKFIDEIEVVG